MPDIPLVSEMPPPPDWINAHGVAAWNRIGPRLVALGLLAEVQLDLFAIWMALHGKMVQKIAAGEKPTASDVGQVRGLARDFGITMDLLARLGSGKDGEKRPANPFRANRRA